MISSLPQGYTLRPPTLDDAQAATDLVNRYSRHWLGKEGITVQQLLASWKDPERDIADENWLIFAPDGSLAALLELYQFPPYTAFEFDGVVDPAHTGLGIGQALIDIIEVRARREMHRAPDGEAVYLRMATIEEDQPARQLMEANGYVRTRDMVRMVIAFDTPPAPPAPIEGIRIRHFRRDQDERAVWQALEDAWVDFFNYAPKPFEEFRYYEIESVDNFDQRLWLLAVDRDKIAGVLMCRPDEPAEPDQGWVSTLAVRQEYRRRGIGQALLQECFVELHRRGFRGAGLSADSESSTNASRLYERAGMREVRRRHVFEKRIR